MIPADPPPPSIAGLLAAGTSRAATGQAAPVSTISSGLIGGWVG